MLELKFVGLFSRASIIQFTYVLKKFLIFFMSFPPKPGNPSQVTRNSQFHLELVHNTTSNLRVLIASLKPSRPLQNC